MSGNFGQVIKRPDDKFFHGGLVMASCANGKYQVLSLVERAWFCMCCKLIGGGMEIHLATADKKEADQAEIHKPPDAY